MLDLSVSWNAANPIFKKLPDAITTTSACTMTSNGEILSASGSFKLYNVKSGPKTWTQIPKSPIGMYKSVTTDPESGLIYAIDTPVDLANYTGELIVANLKTMTFKTSSLPVMNMGFSAWVAWSSHLRSLLVYSRDSMFIYTPSNVNNSSHGWKELNTVGTKPSGGIYFCFMPAYNGSKMVIFSYRGYGDMYILDVATLTWTHYPGAQGVDSACGVSGDQVIIWGGNFLGGVLGKTNIYNMKTDTWTNVYISLSENPTSTATTGLQTPTQHSSSTTPNSDDASPSLSKENYINIAITAGVIVVAAVVALYMYIGYRIRRISGTKNCTHGSVSDLQRVDKELLEESHQGKSQIKKPGYSKDLLEHERIPNTHMPL
ncbi:hypothetical protein BGX31_004903 [Mortierella sp. GBA43]|nr:hypothetical protein BGX31_004903 [Mortierella sp. GBA43]